ncbi:MAG TPA: hypothetical protein DCY88_29570 [Cyanobacteria bacterium UBA11372]|nr:hypothetical protein [Cyanobacteria bacterium UBA11372]
MSAETLEAMFVKRHELAKDLVEVIRISATTANKHFRLLIGPRGIGKTHMMALIYHRVAKMEDLRDKLLIAWLREEEWGVTSFLDLLLRIFRAIAKEYPAEYDDLLNEKVEAFYQLSADEAEYKAAALLREFVGKRVLLLLIENLDDLFDGLGDIGQKQFRAYIQNYSFLTIVATAQSLFNAVRLQTYPFYGFFYTEELEELKLEEARDLLAHIAKLEGDRELESFIQTTTGFDRIRAMHHLAAGNPRVYVVFAQFLSRKSLDKLVEPFMRTLDELTPYYQARMTWLSQPQRKIVEFLVDRRSAVPVTEIAQRSFISVETASSELKDLREKGYVNSDEIGRESFYELREPLMRFCLEVKKQRGEPIRLFIDFLRVWYTRTELQQLLGLEVGEFKQEWGFDVLKEGLIGAQMEESCPEKHYFRYQQPLEPLPADAIMDREYVKRALEALEESEEDPRVAVCWEEYKECCEKKDYVSALEYANKLIEIRGQPKDWSMQAYCLFRLERYEEALESCNKTVAIDFNFGFAWFMRSLVLENLKHYEAALESYDKAIKLDPNNADLWYNRGLLLLNLNRNQEVVESYDKVIELDPNNVFVWLFRGSVLSKINRNQEALESYDKVIELDPNNASVWLFRGNLLYKLNRKQETLESYDKAISFDPNNASIWFLQGYVLEDLNRKQEALESYNKAIELDPNNTSAWLNRGFVLSNIDRKQEALESYDKAIALDSNNASAWFLRSYLLYHFNRKEEALKSYEKAIALEPNLEINWNKIGNVLIHLGRFDKALKACDKAIALGIQSSYVFSNRAISLLALNRWHEGITALDNAFNRFADGEKPETEDSDLIIRNLFNSAHDAAIWKNCIASLIEIYNKYQAVSVLGQGLVKRESISVLMSEMVSDKAAQTWLEVWRELVGDVSEFVIPLRLLNAAVRYKETKGDKRVLLELPIEERNLLQPLLEIN